MAAVVPQRGGQVVLATYGRRRHLLRDLGRVHAELLEDLHRVAALLLDQGQQDAGGVGGAR
eukprot:6010434-Heterocapsa_arctica.AAC.1